MLPQMNLPTFCRKRKKLTKTSSRKGAHRSSQLSKTNGSNLKKIPNFLISSYGFFFFSQEESFCLVEGEHNFVPTFPESDRMFVLELVFFLQTKLILQLVFFDGTYITFYLLRLRRGSF